MIDQVVRSLELHSAECRGDIVAGCAGLGSYYANRGETAQAIAAFEKACATKNDEACNELQRLRSAKP